MWQGEPHDSAWARRATAGPTGSAGRLLGPRDFARQDKVVQYLRNCPEYLESFAAALKGSLVPVNTNYRYGPEELSYLWRDCDARAVVFAGSFTATIERTRASVPGVLAWLWVDDGSGPARRGPPRTSRRPGRPPGRSPAPAGRGRDALLLYTGGTTGLPKGVMWRQDDLFFATLGGGRGGAPPLQRAEDVGDIAAQGGQPAWPPCCLPGRRHPRTTSRWRSVPSCTPAGSGRPSTRCSGGCRAVLYPDRSMDMRRVLALIGEERVTMLTVVGGRRRPPAGGGPRSRPRRVRHLVDPDARGSGGSILSADVKERLLPPYSDGAGDHRGDRLLGVTGAGPVRHHQRGRPLPDAGPSVRRT